MLTTEKRFEEDIESFLISPAGGYPISPTSMTQMQGYMSIGKIKSTCLLKTGAFCLLLVGTEKG